MTAVGGARGSARDRIGPLGSVDQEPVADAAHGLQVGRVRRIDLDLPAQARDLHVDGALVRAVAAAGELLPGHVAAGAMAEDREDFPLALSDPDDVVVPPQLALVEAEDEGPEADRFGRRLLGLRRG